MAGGSAAEIEKEFRAQAGGIPGLRHTVWDQQDLTPKFPKIEKDESADVVVVGAGIAGLSVAYNLVKEGKSVVVLEAKTRGSGQTGRSTAHIMLWFDDFYYRIEKDHGLEIAKLVADSHKKAIEFVENTIKEEEIDCHFCRLDGYLFPHDDSAEAKDIILKEFEACKRVGLNVSIADLGDDPAHGRAGKSLRFTGDSGQGITGGTIGGILIKDMILHRNNPWELAYDPGRRPPVSKTTGKNVVQEVSHTIHGYKDHIPGVGADSIDIEDMKPRSGAVIEKGTKKFAIYKDEKGLIHKYSAICPHMNCIVKWNPIDSTFDCPCHGSMFDNLGRCINGPAKADLFPED